MGAVANGWVSFNLKPAGLVGEAHLAAAEKGRATAAHFVADVVTLLRLVETSDLAGFAPTASR